jgi:hypothetical protein
MKSSTTRKNLTYAKKGPFFYLDEGVISAFSNDLKKLINTVLLKNSLFRGKSKDGLVGTPILLGGVIHFERVIKSSLSK